MTADDASLLYARVLGPAWFALPPCVRALHSTFEPRQLRGRFEIRHGSRPGVGWLIRLLGLPRSSAALPVVLTVQPQADREHWTRRFGERILMTRQWSGAERRLCERFGIMEFRFNLEVVDGQLRYHQREAALRLGGFGIRLPRWVAPTIQASEKAAAEPDGVEVSVQVQLPLLGLLLAYRGVVTSDEGMGT